MSQILNELNEIIYISDLDNFELKFINDAGLKFFNIKKFEQGQKCFKFIYNLDSPCPNCPRKKVSESKYYEWNFFDKERNKTFKIHDKLITWQDKKCQLHVAEDITENLEQVEELKITENTERTIINCIKILHNDNNLDKNISELLSETGKFINAERAYIFKIDYETNTLISKYYWKDSSIKIESVANNSLSPIQNWLKKMTKGEIICIYDKNSVPKLKPEYSLMQLLDLQSVILAPIFSTKKELVGFICADNFNISISEKHINMLFQTLSSFLTAIIEKSIINEKLSFLSYHDTLTNLQNRNKYSLDIQKYKKNKITNVGIAFIDMNGLKRLNDSKGHTAGDKALKEIANILLNAFNEEFVYRIGGDEFVVIYPNISKIIFMQGISILQAFSANKNKPSMAIGYEWFENISDLEKNIKEVDSLMYDDKNRFYNHYRATHSI